MKKLLSLFCFLLLMMGAFSQGAPGDAMLQKISAERNDDKRLDLILAFFSGTQESDPVLDMENAQKLLRQAQQANDKISEAAALGEIGFNYWSFGNIVKHLEFDIRALAIAEGTGNMKLIALTKNFLGHNYSFSLNSDYPKAIQLYKEAEQAAIKGGSDTLQSWTLMNLGSTYYNMGQLDSALMYTQKAYELITRIRYNQYLSNILIQFGDLHAKMGNTALALNYYALAVNEAFKVNAIRFKSMAYQHLAQFYKNNNQLDSAAVYARKAIASLQYTPYLYEFSAEPAQLLLNIYRNRNSDSALKYSEMYRMANDSLYNARRVQQAQVLTFENEQRQQELRVEKMKEEEQRKENIQYAMIGLGIIVLISLFLLLSRSFITNPRTIEFCSIVGLLILFEFLNLLLHPFLEKITGHSPILMLAALVVIASLLVPLHHRIEKWAKAKLVEKNKQIRLNAAKRTIEQLGGDTGRNSS